MIKHVISVCLCTPEHTRIFSAHESFRPDKLSSHFYVVLVCKRAVQQSIWICVYMFARIYVYYLHEYQMPLNGTQYNIPTSWTGVYESPPTRKYMENNSDTAGDLCGVQGLIHGNLPEPRPSEWIARHEITWRTMRLALPLTSRALLTIVARARAGFTNFFPDFFFARVRAGAIASSLRWLWILWCFSYWSCRVSRVTLQVHQVWQNRPFE